MAEAQGSPPLPLVDFAPPGDILEDPSVVPNPETAVQQFFENITVEIRYGTFEGRQYGWVRVLNGNPDDNVTFFIDIDGDRLRDYYDIWRVGDRNYTRGYPTTPGPERAFQGCVGGRSFDGGCTDWW